MYIDTKCFFYAVLFLDGAIFVCIFVFIYYNYKSIHNDSWARSYCGSQVRGYKACLSVHHGLARVLTDHTAITTHGHSISDSFTLNDRLSHTR